MISKTPITDPPAATLIAAAEVANPPAALPTVDIPPNAEAAESPTVPAAAPCPTALVPGVPRREASKAPLHVDRIIGELDLRSPTEELEFQECESMVRAGWTHFAAVGQALRRIRDKQLYRNEFSTFEDYCRQRWGLAFSQVCRYIAAAQVHQQLEAIPGIPLPECEAQVRPLVGLLPEQAQQAWLTALSSSSTGYVPARVVKRVVRDIVKVAQPDRTAASTALRQSRARKRQEIRTGFQELQTLVLKGAQREMVLGKLQELEGLVSSLLWSKRARL